MPNQSAKQQARRAALDAQTKMRAQRAEQERRRTALAVQVLTALAERDALIAVCERRAGEALVTMTEAEAMTVREAVQWCGSEQVTLREAIRLRQIAQSARPAQD